MRLRPSQVYQNGVIVFGVFIIFYIIYTLVTMKGDYSTSYRAENAKHSKNLYLTIDKNRMDDRFKTLAPKRILLWTTIFGSYDNAQVRDCPGLENRCIFDHDRDNMEHADAVLFHASNMELRDLPDDSKRNVSQRYVFMTMETPQHGVRFRPPKRFFNWTMTPLFSSDVLFKYGGFLLSAKEAELRGLKMESFALDESKFLNKLPAVIGLISNCQTDSRRELALAELNRYFNVTIAGGCGKTEELKRLCPKGSCNEEELFGRHAFFFAGENTACKDYVTEKYFSRMKYPSIPIILRRSDYEHVNLPPKSVIALEDFKGPREMGEYLHKLVKDQTAYLEYFAWRRGGWTMAPWNSAGFRNGHCRLCERLWEEEQKTSIVEDVVEWYTKESQCDDGRFVKEWISQ